MKFRKIQVKLDENQRIHHTKIQINLVKMQMNLDEIQMKFRQNLEKRFRRNLDKIQTKFRTYSRLIHFETIQTNLFRQKVQTNLEEFRTYQNLDKFRQDLDKFRTPLFTDVKMLPLTFALLMFAPQLVPPQWSSLQPWTPSKSLQAPHSPLSPS